MITKVRRKMKNILMPLSDKLNLRKRGLIDRAAGAVCQ
jgi:hypothetical protein